MHDAGGLRVRSPQERRLSARGIEVGHIFYFGTKYSEPMKAVVAGPDGQEHAVHIGSYGSRPGRACAPPSSRRPTTRREPSWPDAIAPFRVGLLNLKVGDSGTDAASETLYRALGGPRHRCAVRRPRGSARSEIRDRLDLIGLPWQALIGPEGAGRR
jgi:prolyl-tRNA synthetase